MPRALSQPVPRTERADVPLKRKALSLAIFLIAAASMLNAMFGDRGLLELLRARREIESMDREIAELRETNEHLLQEVRGLKSSPLAIERLARENMGLVKPGEIVLLIRPPAEAAQPPSPTTDGVGPSESESTSSDQLNAATP